MLITEYTDKKESAENTSSNTKDDKLITDILENYVYNIKDHILK